MRGSVACASLPPGSRSCRSVHSGGNDVLAGTLHGAAVNRQMLLSVLPVVHTPAIRFKAVDLALDRVALFGASGSVAQLLQLADQVGSPA